MNVPLILRKQLKQTYLYQCLYNSLQIYKLYLDLAGRIIISIHLKTFQLYINSLVEEEWRGSRTPKLNGYRILGFNQGYKGINKWPTNWFISPRYKHKNTPSVDYNYWLKRLDTHLSEPTNQNSVKVLNLAKQTKRKTLL